MIWIVYIVIVLLLIVVFLFASRRKETNVQVTNYELPTYIDITDIKSNSEDFFVIIFSSENCDGCKIVLEKAKVLKGKCCKSFYSLKMQDSILDENLR